MPLTLFFRLQPDLFFALLLVFLSYRWCNRRLGQYYGWARLDESNREVLIITWVLVVIGAQMTWPGLLSAEFGENRATVLAGDQATLTHWLAALRPRICWLLMGVVMTALIFWKGYYRAWRKVQVQSRREKRLSRDVQTALHDIGGSIHRLHTSLAPADQKAAIMSMRHSSHLLQIVLEDAFELSATARIAPRTQKCHPFQVVQDMVARWQPRFEARDMLLELRNDLPVGYSAAIDRRRFRLLLSLMLENCALRRQNGLVEVRAEWSFWGPAGEEGCLRMAVSDGSPPMDPAQLQKALATLESTELPDLPDDSVAGLGLWLRLVQSLNGRIAMQNRSPHGSPLAVEIPCLLVPDPTLDPWMNNAKKMRDRQGAHRNSWPIGQTAATGSAAATLPE